MFILKIIYRNNICVTKETYQLKGRHSCLLSFVCNSKDCPNEKKQIEVLQYSNTSATKYTIFVGILYSINNIFLSVTTYTTYTYTFSSII